MNIFVLDRDPIKAVSYMCDQHIVKMALESAQMLSTVAVQKVPDYANILYKPCYKHHPCTIWTGISDKNYEWHVQHAMAICKEFTYRYGGTHGSNRVITVCHDIIQELKLPNIGLTPFAQAMPDKYKDQDAVVAYRSYYVGEKIAWARWSKTRSKPHWISTSLNS